MLTAAEVQACGDATDDQRTELRALIERKAVTADWVRRFYDEVRTAGGLSRGAARAALNYLRPLDVKPGQPTHATPEQGDTLRGLIRTRIVPAKLARLWLARLDAGELTYDQADLRIREYRRLPLRAFVAADIPAAATAGGQVSDGYFALTGADGRVRCYRIHSVGAGRRVDQVTGERPSQRRRIRGWQATQIMREVAGGTAAAARLYGEIRNRCSACNVRLFDETQPGFPHGYGEKCWRDRQAAAVAPPAAESLP